MTTDTPKRLSDAELVRALNEIAEWGNSFTPQRSEIVRQAAERLTTPPAQGKVERARVVEAINKLAYEYRNEHGGEHFDDHCPVCPSLKVLTDYAAITQALTESSGQMDEEVSAILRTLNSVPDSAEISETDAKVSVGLLRRLLTSGQGTDVVTEQVIRQLDRAVAWIDEGKTYEISVLRGLLFHASSVLRRTSGTDGACCEAMREKAAKVCDDFIERHSNAEDLKLWPVRECVERIRALPLPVSADGRDAVIEECAQICDVKARASSQSVGTFSTDGHRRRAEGQANGAKNCAAAIRRLKPKQPSDTRAGR